MILKFKKYLPKSMISFGICLLLGIVLQVAALVQPYFGGALIDKVQEGLSFAPDIALIASLLLISALLSFFQQLLLGKISEDVVLSTRSVLIRLYIAMPYQKFISKKPSWFSERVVRDVEFVKIIPSQLLLLIQSFILLVGSLVCMLLISLETLCIGALFALVLTIFTFFASKPLKFFKHEYQEANMNFSSQMQELHRASKLLRAYNKWEQYRPILSSLAFKSYEAALRLSRLNSALSPIGQSFMQLANLGTIVYAAFEVARGTLEFPSLVMFVMYFSYFSSAITQFLTVVRRIREAEACDERIEELFTFASQEEGCESYSLPQNQGEHSEGFDIERSIECNRPPSISFNEVSFRYTDSPTLCLDKISFNVPSGKITALIGESGAGKTSCINLIEQFYTDYSGSITCGSKDLREFSETAIRELCSYVDQENLMLQGSIGLNIKVGNPKASEDEMLEIMGLLGCDLSDSNLTLETSCANISGGQKQKVAIARALVKKGSVIIMDEPSSSLDGISEACLLRVLKTLRGKKTILLSSHRFSLIKEADWLVVFCNGRVLDEGLHEDLLERCDYYRELAKSY